MKEIITKTSTDTTSDGRDVSKYSINGNGSYNKTELVIECVRMVVKDLVENKNVSLEEAVERINKIDIHPQVVSTFENAYREKKRCKAVETDVDGDNIILYINNQWSASNIDVFINGISELLENIDESNNTNQDSGRMIESIDISDFAICLAGFSEEVNDAVKTAIKKVPKEKREDVVDNRWLKEVPADCEEGLGFESVDSFVDFYSMDNNPEMVVVNYEDGGESDYFGEYEENDEGWPMSFNEIEGDTYERSTCDCLMRYTTYDRVSIRFVPDLEKLKPEDKEKLSKPFDVQKLSYLVNNVTIGLNGEEYRIVTSILYDGIPFLPEDALDMSDWNEMTYFIRVDDEVYSIVG